MKKKLDIIFITPRFIYPLFGGDRVKPYYILKHLARHHNVTLCTQFQGGHPPKEYVDEIEKLGVELKYTPLFPKNAVMTGILPHLFSWPLEIGFYSQREYLKMVDKLFEERNFDLGFSFFMRTAEHLKKRNIKKILMAEDCRVVYQKRSAEESKSLKHKIVRNWEYQLLKKYEPNIVNHFDITTLVTNEDIAMMKKRNPNVEYRLLTNGTDIEKFIPGDFEKRSGILFAGRLDIWANVLMIKQIVNEILPEVRKSIPDATLDIVGAMPIKEVLDLKSDIVKLHIDVPEMIPYLQKARVFIHPHKGGSGIQNKLIEAMACGCPVVTTQTGIQGFPAVDGRDVLLCETSSDFAGKTIDLLENDELAKKISLNCRQLIVDNLSWQAVYESLDNIISELFA
jgi:glycosyltransferase involved in cell wall biosynthesis